MDTDARAFVGGKAIEDAVVEGDEAAQQLLRRMRVPPGAPFRDDGRPGLFEPADRIADSAVVQVPHLVLRDSARGELLHAVDELGRPGNASDGFCRYCHEA